MHPELGFVSSDDYSTIHFMNTIMCQILMNCQVIINILSWIIIKRRTNSEQGECLVRFDCKVLFFKLKITKYTSNSRFYYSNITLSLHDIFDLSFNNDPRGRIHKIQNIFVNNNV